MESEDRVHLPETPHASVARFREALLEFSSRSTEDNAVVYLAASRSLAESGHEPSGKGPDDDGELPTAA
jgi:hypothetical protein